MGQRGDCTVEVQLPPGAHEVITFTTSFGGIFLCAVCPNDIFRACFPPRAITLRAAACCVV